MADKTKSNAKKPFKKGKQNQDKGGGDGDQGNEPPRAVLALHPSDAAIALAVGGELRVFDNKANKLHVLLGSTEGDSTATNPTTPPAVVRCIAFSRCGKFLAAGTDDKTSHIFSTETWKLIKSLKSPKKISAVNFSADGSVLLAANKFGDVGVTPTDAPTGKPSDSQFEIFFGHYCSVITSLSMSHYGALLAGTDRDGKVRINKMPESDYLQGCHEIQCFGFGHTDFVSCSAFVKQGEREVLVSGGGDGTLRMWDVLTGGELSMLQVGSTTASTTKTTEGEEEVSAEDKTGKEPQPVLAVCPSQDGKHLVVALDGVKDLCIVAVDFEANTLVESGRCAVDGVPFATDICRDTSGKFFIASGPLQTTGNAAGENLAAVVVCCELDKDGKTLHVSTSEVLPADAKVQLQKCDELQVEIEKIAPQKVLPGYLHKRAFIPQEEYITLRKAGKKEHGAGPSAATAEEEEDEDAS